MKISAISTGLLLAMLGISHTSRVAEPAEEPAGKTAAERNIYRQQGSYQSTSSEFIEMLGISMNSEVRKMDAPVTYKYFAALRLLFRQAPQRPRKVAPVVSSGRTVTVVSEPNTIVWLDEIRRGTTDQAGRLALLRISSGAHTLRLRANGFKETTMPLLAAQRGEIKIRLMRTTDEAELTFQQAETARETARDDGTRRKAVDLYRQALKLRPAFPAAHVGFARLLLELNDTNAALAEIENARRSRANYPEASAVEGRIYREIGQTDEAIGSFNRAIRESHGFQPEAHVGIGRVYEEKGQYELAARELKIAIDQLADTEPIIYQLLGAAYEKTGNAKEAITAYENYLRLAPNGSLAPAVRSIVEQLKSQPPN